MTNEDKRYEKTVYAVEANRFEQVELMRLYSSTTEWKEDLGGYLPTVGMINDRPVVISVLWAEIDGVTVMFYHPTSTMVCYHLVEEWIAKQCKCFRTSFDSDTFGSLIREIRGNK